MEYVKNLADRMNYRFESLRGKEEERRIWSIRIHEFLVAFHINRGASSLVSEPTDNEGISDGAADFRHDGSPAAETVRRIAAMFPFRANTPLLKATGLKGPGALRNPAQNQRPARPFR